MSTAAEVERSTRRSERTGGPRPTADLAASPFRADRDRVSSSAFFARLGGVTQVVSPSGSGLLLHNRLTHSLKVAQVARAIAERLLSSPDDVARLDRLGGCDLDVVEAAALGHDLGHPPFGHQGERVLDRLAENPLVEADFFPGDLLTVVLRVPAEHWRAHPDQHARIERIITSVADPDPELTDEITAFRART